MATTQISLELLQLRLLVTQMGDQVREQLDALLMVLETGDQEAILEVELAERQADVWHQRIEVRCEQVLALFAPVARDLRMVFAINKMASDLEYVSDSAQSAVGFYQRVCQKGIRRPPVDVQLTEMMRLILSMFDHVMRSFDDERRPDADQLDWIEQRINRINIETDALLAGYLRGGVGEHEALNALMWLSIVRKLEKIGDFLVSLGSRVSYFMGTSDPVNGSYL
ncbi:MAG: phosphate signaling complex PhoU family protein [Bacteroidia bacterium]